MQNNVGVEGLRESSGGLFPGFSRIDIRVNETSLHIVTGGAGEPVLLLHGYPQTHVMWHQLAPALASRFTLICPDLRGYGDSDKPTADRTHATYSKRVMAEDQVELMQSLGLGASRWSRTIVGRGLHDG